jgi:hypothetical protein
MAHQDPKQNRPGSILGLEVPGDTDSADIVDRTGEQMPRQSHDGVTDDERERSTRVNDAEERVAPAREGSVGDPDRHDNPRTGRISDW